MSARTEETKREATVDHGVVKAIGHPLRMKLLGRLNQQVCSPVELARELDESVQLVSYHVRILRELDCLELVQTEPRRGALEHFYRAKVSPWLSDEQWSQLPATFRRKTLARTLSEILEAAAKAGGQGGFDGPESHASRVALALDEAGRTEIAALLAETREAALGIHAASAGRHTVRPRDPSPDRHRAGPHAPLRGRREVSTLRTQLRP